MKNLVEFKGIWFYEGTANGVMENIIRLTTAQKRARIRVFYGDSKTGIDWCESYDTMGYIGITNGTKKIPILVKNTSSSGGTAILTDCIVRITLDKQDIYRHPNYTCKVDYRINSDGTCTLAKIKSDGSGLEVMLHTKDEKSAKIACEYFRGKRNTLNGAEYINRKAV